jgi:O-acetylhomoserine (thiol)-lyase
LKWAHDLPAPLAPIAFALRFRTVPLRNLGAAIAPDNSFLFLQGLETLPIRMDKHSANALKVAEFLKQHPKVAWVRYPGLKGDPTHATAAKYLKNGFGGMVVFGLKAGYDAAVKVIDNIKLFSHLANVGDAKSLVIHPASTTHFRMTDEALAGAGITQGTIRLSIGLEDADDLIDDLKRALKAAEKAA